MLMPPQVVWSPCDLACKCVCGVLYPRRRRRTAIGVRCTDGVIIAAEKLMASKMLVKTSNKVVHKVDEHIGVVSWSLLAAHSPGRQALFPDAAANSSLLDRRALPGDSQVFSGVTADGKAVVKMAQNICASYKQNYHERIAPGVLAEQLADVLYAYTSYAAYRPFGVHVMVCGYDDDKRDHELYLCELDGTFTVSNLWWWFVVCFRTSFVRSALCNPSYPYRHDHCATLPRSDFSVRLWERVRGRARRKSKRHG